MGDLKGKGPQNEVYCGDIDHGFGCIDLGFFLGMEYLLLVESHGAFESAQQVKG